MKNMTTEHMVRIVYKYMVCLLIDSQKYEVCHMPARICWYIFWKRSPIYHYA